MQERSFHPVEGEANRLITELDRDRDKKITVNDFAKTSPRFTLRSTDGSTLEVEGVYAVSNLLQELALGGAIDSRRVFENPVDRISRSIRERYWDGLTRRVDAAHLAEALRDEKLIDQPERYVYVPASDDKAFAHFTAAAEAAASSGAKIHVVRLPERLTPQYMRSLRGRHGLLTLGLRPGADGALEGVPFVVPGGRFNEMYGWDSYFEALGLLQDGRLDLAQAMADNQVYQIEHYGKILNANRSYYLNRSQPPFLTSFLFAVHDRMEANDESRAWLERGMKAAMKEYENVWMNRERLTATGLSRYHGTGDDIPPEVETGAFDFILRPAARRHQISIERLGELFNSGRLRDEQLSSFFMHDRAVRESGHDTTYRWRVQGEDRAADFVTVDLNALLYKYELDISRWWRDFKGNSEQARNWRAKADKRRRLMLRYLWDPERRMFFDYDFKRGWRSRYVSATAFYPFWAEDPTDPSTRFLPESEAQQALSTLIGKLEAPGGLAATARASLQSVPGREVERQWDHPNGWPPHQMMAWAALANHQRDSDRFRLIYKWLRMIARNAADFNGTVPEKFDVVQRSHLVFAEYGNVGTSFAYITREGFGWMNASFQVGLAALPQEWRERLRRLEESP